MGRLTALVLGSAAGGGFPQWNCRCPTCRLAWAGDPRVRPRTQSSLAVTADGENWLLINASPDLPQQLRQTKPLHPRGERRGSPIKAVLLTGGEIDQIAGLLSLREREPFLLCATAVTLATLAENVMFGVMAPDVVKRKAIVPAAPLVFPGGLQAQLFTVPGKMPLYLEGDKVETASETAGNVGVELHAGNARVVYIPGAAAVTAAMMARMRGADVVFFDGTLFRDDEMITTGTGAKTGRRMGHMPIGGDEGSLAALDGLAGRRIYVHINNTNPILIDGSPERVHVVRKAWEVAEDGMEVVL
ncbi:MAG TPA: pyrroloquinoline quinone biosynthesis protein PqqB [Xanthobacteraceae bacterium]|nr:pyrroloquinoline quinone biosynthesis protein PqqB [Xanthobacteraceae bacterium]